VQLQKYANECTACEFKEAAIAEIKSCSLVWVISKDLSQDVGISLYSQVRNWQWPGGGSQLTLRQPSLSYNINCEPGENICCGAWFNGNSKGKYWGAGFGGRKGCRGCCWKCGAGEAHVNLTR
jgi:hypothetical protein